MHEEGTEQGMGASVEQQQTSTHGFEQDHYKQLVSAWVHVYGARCTESGQVVVVTSCQRSATAVCVANTMMLGGGGATSCVRVLCV